MHPELAFALEHVYTPSGLKLDHYKEENQSVGACSFQINSLKAKFRVARKTPKKKGRFVTFWKRDAEGKIVPYDRADPFDLFVVSVSHSTQIGQFIFPKKMLCDQGVLSSETADGKRAIRVYPPWEAPISQQAKKTQQWQLPYFLELVDTLNRIQLQKLLSAELPLQVKPS